MEWPSGQEGAPGDCDGRWALPCHKGWVTFGQGKTPGEVEKSGEGLHRGGTKVNPEVCNSK